MVTQVPQQLQPIEIEALAAYKALEFARELGISEAVLEGDSSLVMTALASKNPGLAPFGLLLQDSLMSLLAFRNCPTLTLRERATQLHTT